MGGGGASFEKWGGQEVKLIARRYTQCFYVSFLLWNKYAGHIHLVHAVEPPLSLVVDNLDTFHFICVAKENHQSMGVSLANS